MQEEPDSGRTPRIPFNVFSRTKNHIKHKGNINNHTLCFTIIIFYNFKNKCKTIVLNINTCKFFKEKQFNLFLFKKFKI